MGDVLLDSLHCQNDIVMMLQGSDIMTRLGEVVGEAVGSGASDVDIDHEEAESALLSCEEGLAKRFDSILGGV